MTETRYEEILSGIFGSYKAEWLKEQLYELYAEPSYFTGLLTNRPCILIGGRGTGKTTVLRCLSYEGQLALKRNSHCIKSWDYYGFYYRVNTNRINAFCGQGKSDDFWRPIFSHYLNLVIAELFANFLLWYEQKANEESIIDSGTLSMISESLCIALSNTASEFKQNIDKARIAFENYINNIDEERQPRLSIQAGPIDLMFKSICSLDGFANSKFFILIDEYENFLDYQQQIFNSLIKHSGIYYTFKIGVRELGWRVRTILNSNEYLVSPADYIEINISEALGDNRFSDFARKVCNERLQKIKVIDGDFFYDISTALESMTDEEEAITLGVNKAIEKQKWETKNKIKKEDLEILNTKSPLEQYSLLYFSFNKRNEFVSEELSRLIRSPKWKVKYDNYKHALLFTIAPKDPKRKKYYCGWESFVHISGFNIRYLLELVEQTLLLYIRSDAFHKKRQSYVNCEIQTKAAYAVGRKNLMQLEGLTIWGADITKLVLSLGRIFQLLAERHTETAPEVTHFDIKTTQSFPQKERLDQIILHSVMHLALLRFPGSKLNAYDVKDSDYMLHPIFTPFFVYSYRKKRKISLQDAFIIKLIDDSSSAIRQYLNNKKISFKESAPPSQLSLFSEHFNDN